MVTPTAEIGALRSANRPDVAMNIIRLASVYNAPRAIVIRKAFCAGVI